jgi:hypothetical protein
MNSPRRTFCKINTSVDPHEKRSASPFVLKTGALPRLRQKKSSEPATGQQPDDFAQVCQQVRRDALAKTWAIGGLGIYSSHKGHLRVISSTAVSKEFKQAVDDYLKQIPIEIREIVRRKNTEILLLANAGELDPQLAALQAERHPGGGAMAYMPVFYEATLNAIIFSEQLALIDGKDNAGTILAPGAELVYNPRLGVWGDGLRPELTLDRCAGHEFGHAVDNALLHFSLSKAFDHAFWQDFAGIAEGERARLSGLLVPDSAAQDPESARNAAKEEIFAELFALHQGLRRTSIAIDDLLKDRMPAMVKLIKHKIDHLFTR